MQATSETLPLERALPEPQSPYSPKSQPLIIKIYNTHFDPPSITCNPETTIRWVVIPVKEQNSNSLYYGVTRGHVIGFEQIGVESPYLDPNRIYELTFHQPGIYNYKCMIFGDLQGSIEVLSKEEFAVSAEDIRDAKGNMKGAPKSICSVGASTDIEKPMGEDSTGMIMKDEREENIKKIIEKYLKKAKWELPVELAIEIDKIEKEIPFFEEDKKEETGKKKKSRNKRRRQKAKRRAFMDCWKDESALFRQLLRMNLTEILSRGREIIESSTKLNTSRSALIRSCMNTLF